LKNKLKKINSKLKKSLSIKYFQHRAETTKRPQIAIHTKYHTSILQKERLTCPASSPRRLPTIITPHIEPD
jgi:hypothetical protein